MLINRCIGVLTAFGLAAGLGVSSALAADPVIEACIVKVQDDVSIPAEVPGTLMKMPLKEGARVRKGQLLATIDDREAQAALEVAQISLKAAEKRAESDIEKRYAVAASEVAKADWEQDIEANKQHKGSVPETVLRRKQLEYDKLVLQIEKAENDQVLADYEVKVKQAEVDAANVALDRRQIRSPFDGEVVKLYLHEAEWASPGDPILRLVSLETLYVEGLIESSQWDPGEVDGRPVTIRVRLARGREVEAVGKITYVSQLVRAGGEYLIRAEVNNQREGNHWLIRPGLETTMTIHLGSRQGAESKGQ